MALRGFRFHLSTALLLMVTAGGLLGLNFTRRLAEIKEEEVKPSGGIRLFFYETQTEFRYGFPALACRMSCRWIFNANAEVVNRISTWTDSITTLHFDKKDAYLLKAPDFFWSGILIDSSFAIFVLIAVGYVSEKFIGRKKAVAVHSLKKFSQESATE